MKKNTAIHKWLFHESKHITVYLILLIIIGIILSFLGVFFAFLSKNLLDIATGNLSGSVIKSAIHLAALILIQLIMQILSSAIHVRAGAKLVMSMRRKTFYTLLTKSYQSVSSYHSGDLINRLNSDVGFVSEAITQIVPSVLTFLSRIFLSFVALYFFDPVFASILLVVGPIILLTSSIYRTRMKKLHKKCQESDGKTRSFMQECLQNILAIKSFGGEKVITAHSNDLQNVHYKYSIKRNNISIVANILFYITLTIGYYFALGWGAIKISKGLMTFGTLTAMLQLVGQIQTPFRQISSILPQYFSMTASAERIIELQKLPDDTDFCGGELNYKEIYDRMEGIVLHKVCFSYDNINVLKDADFFINKGEIVAVSGDSGIGKSTFLKLLLGIIKPANGELHIKFQNESTVSLDKNTRRLFAYVPQGNMILSGTIRDNISFLHEPVDEDKIIKSAQTAEIWHFIDSLPDKLDTLLGEKGLGLSDGQIQRIAIARAIYYDAPVILLDEATSALDEKTEVALLENLKKLKDKTCVIVSHRKAAFEICHKAVKIHDGKFEEVVRK